MFSYSSLARKIKRTQGQQRQMAIHRPEVTHRYALFEHTIFLNVFEIYCYCLGVRFHM